MSISDLEWISLPPGGKDQSPVLSVQDVQAESHHPPGSHPGQCLHQVLSLQSVRPSVRWYSCLDLSLYFSLSSMISEASTIFGPEKEQVLSEKMRTIVEGFRSRAKTVKQRIEQPPTPTGSLSGQYFPNISILLLVEI